MFETLTVTGGDYLCLLGPDGNLNSLAPQAPLLSDREILSAYRMMLLARQADEWAVSLNRQGRMATYPPNKGQEANAVGAVLALREDDWLVPAFRELGALIAKGVPLHQVYTYWYGNEQGSNLAPEIYRTMPIAIPVGSQPLHAVGRYLQLPADRAVRAVRKIRPALETREQESFVRRYLESR